MITQIVEIIDTRGLDNSVLQMLSHTPLKYKGVYVEDDTEFSIIENNNGENIYIFPERIKLS